MQLGERPDDPVREITPQKWLIKEILNLQIRLILMFWLDFSFGQMTTGKVLSYSCIRNEQKKVGGLNRFASQSGERRMAPD